MKRLPKYILLRPLIFCAMLSGLFLTNCRKDCCNQLNTSNVPEVSTDSVSIVTQSTARSGGMITQDGGSPILACGVCWSLAQLPTLTDSSTSDSMASGSFTSTLTGLFPNTTYYVRAYATNSSGTGYGNERSFTTLSAPILPTLTTAAVTNVTNSTASSGGTVSSDGGTPVTQRGVCYNTSPAPTITTGVVPCGSGTGTFVCNLTNLLAGTVYYVRAYAINSAGTGYGNEVTFTTLTPPGLPVLTTTAVYNIAFTDAWSGGDVTSHEGSPVTVKGVCWSTSSNPTTADNFTTDGNGVGNYSSILTGLTPGTLYYVRAYATNAVGTAYGNEVSFTTMTPPTLPTVTTAWASNTTQITSTSGGDVTSDGGDPVWARGVCWSTVSGPTISDPHTTDGTGTGTFISQITNLQPNTQYYIRAYATNGIGTAYGNEVGALTTADGSVCPAVPTVSYGGQVYTTVMIGTQCWIRENLNIGNMVPGSSDQTDDPTMEKYCYDDLTTNCDEYGGLYQWGEMVQYLNGASNTTTWNPAPTGYVQGICPPGWHLPSNDEYTTLTTYLGGENVAGGKMKEAGFAHWNAPNTGATNESGFTVLPAGTRTNMGGFIGLNAETRLWSVSGNWPAADWMIYLHYLNERAEPGTDDKASGNSVRCLKD